jgi:hypothetical protein
MRTHLPLAALAVLLAACRVGERRAAAADSTAGPAVDPASVPGRFALELWQLRDVTLGEWRAAHADDVVIGEDSSGTASYLGSWCAEAVHVYDARGRKVERRAFFYPPPPPSVLTPPDSANDLVLSCRLGFVLVGFRVADVAEGERLADSVRSRLDTVFGAGQRGAVSFLGSAFWSVTGRWRHGDLVAASALSAPPGSRAGADDGALPRVLAIASLPISGVSVEPLSPRPPRFYAPPDTLPLDSAARLAGLDTTLSGILARTARASPQARAAGPPDSLVRPLVRWLRSAPALPPSRRAAALYTADRVLDRAMCAYRMCDLQDSIALRPLQELGARFTYSPLSGTWLYARSWLAQARALDRDSPLGQRVLLEQLENGFDFSGTCRGGTEAFRTVIDNGERYLARAAGSPIAADVHFLVAEAYRDIVALAAGAGDIYADSSRYSAEAGAAARHALEHYAAAIAAGAGGPTARQAWARAWWLRAGLHPRDVRFLCIYD